MSLEQALNENTAAIKALGLIMAGLSASSSTIEANPTAGPTVVEKTYTDGTKVKGPDPLPDQSPAQQDAASKGSAPKTADPVATASATGAAVTYDDAKAAITSVVKAKGRAGGLAVLTEFGTETLTIFEQGPVETWVAVIAACEKALAK